MHLLVWDLPEADLRHLPENIQEFFVGEEEGEGRTEREENMGILSGQ
jgi:hypothetical protein